jgi:hypothetical protein
MSKPEPSVNPSPSTPTITLTEAELQGKILAAVAAAVATATIQTQRGLVGTEGMTATQEERVANQLGRPVPQRRPWPIEVATARYDSPDMAAPVEFTVDIQVKDRDHLGRPLDPPTRMVTRVRDIKFPPIPEMQRKHGRDDNSTFTMIGGKLRSDIKEGARFQIDFLQHVIYEMYERPVRTMFQGKELRHVRPYLVGDVRPVVPDEVRRENDGDAVTRLN